MSENTAWSGDIDTFVCLVHPKIAELLEMESDSCLSKELYADIREALINLRVANRLAAFNCSPQELECFMADAKKVELALASMKASPIGIWIQSKHGLRPSDDKFTGKFLAAAKEFEHEFKEFRQQGALLVDIKDAGLNRLIVNDLPRIYARYSASAQLKAGLEEHRLPDLVGQFNPNSAVIGFVKACLEVLSIPNREGAWTEEALVKRLKRARDGRKKKS
ncbi:MAG: hypothetical protein LCH39_04010 [Proteobacteria bacterium]|nr:hypothetical protein [Pseudomonadota bacterium]